MIKRSCLGHFHDDQKLAVDRIVKTIIEGGRNSPDLIVLGGIMTDLDLEIIEVLHQSITHAKEVARREHIKAIDRHERVALFVTSIRTFMHHEFYSYMSRSTKIALKNWLCGKRTWYDIGVPSDFCGPGDYFARHEESSRDLLLDEASHRTVTKKMTNETLMGWMSYIQDVDDDEDPIERVSGGLKEIKKEMSFFTFHIKKADAASDRIDILVGKLDELITQGV